MGEDPGLIMIDLCKLLKVLQASHENVTRPQARDGRLSRAGTFVPYCAAEDVMP